MDVAPKRLYVALAVVVTIAAVGAWSVATYLGDAKNIALLLLLLVAEGAVTGLVDNSRPRLRQGAWLIMVVAMSVAYLATVFVS